MLKDEHAQVVKTDEKISMNKSGPAENKARPKDGITTLIGQTANSLKKLHGSPDRVDISAYGYQWWIYNADPEKYMQVGVENGKIVTIFAAGKDLDVSPYKIGQSINEIYSSTPLNQDIQVQYDQGTYRFELSEEDLNIRPIVQLGDIYLQLYLDKFKGTLSSVRVLDKGTLIKLRPYEMVYRGELKDPEPPSEFEWTEIDKGSEKQILDLTNIIRKRFGLNPLEWDEETSKVAFQHSKDMYENQYFSHTSPQFGDLSDRLNEAEVFYQMAGENIAAKYADGPAAVEGWLNSSSHRETMLKKEFTHLGVGVYQKYYTQNFLQKDWE
ncbi:uncharacterized protein YkwD [Falsibacillus pallidus]|uniref:Uncharacterized protein YkwD n=1 Tax=Falsibacillus pallidus TaxID=493781 RepID=A0A370GY77_9BACI|nr:uncharacterized protein YkwD [Falsibacillus pallidus]